MLCKLIFTTRLRKSRSIAVPMRLGLRRCSNSAGIANIREVCSKNRHYFVHFGNLIVLGAINQTDMLNLRGLSVVATTCGIVYNLLQPVPLWAPASWGLFFIGTHLYYIREILRERQEIDLTTERHRAYTLSFGRAGFTQQQFCDILDTTQARWCTFREGTFIHERGDKFDEVTLLLDGKVAQLSSTDDYIQDVVPGNGGWLGEAFDPVQDLEKIPDQRRIFSWKCVAEQCRTLSLSRLDFHKYVNTSPRLREAAIRIQVNDFGHKQCYAIPHHRRTTYQKMLEMALTDGVLDDKERVLLSDWRERHKIPDENHVTMLQDLGWTQQEFEAGKRHSS